MASAKASSTGAGDGVARERSVLRLHPDTKAQVDYWGNKRGFSSANEYMAEAVEEKIARENGDYDLPTLEIARLNQLIEVVKSLEVSVNNLARISNAGFATITGLTRGDNYLGQAEEDGELS